MADGNPSPSEEPEVTVESIQNEIADRLNSLLGTSSTYDTSQAVMLLALVQEEHMGAEELGDSARYAYEDLYERYEAELLRDRRGRHPTESGVTDAEVKGAMANGVIAQFEALNNGQPLSEEAKTKLRSLFDNENGAEGFAAAIIEDNGPYKQYKTKLREYEQYRVDVSQGRAQDDQSRRPPPMPDGIMLALLKPNANGDSPAFDQIDVSGVNISPEDQAHKHELSAMKAIIDFNTMGGGAETALARLHGVPQSTWGEFNGDPHDETKNWVGYQNLDRVIGPRNPEQREAFWRGDKVNDTITSRLEERGIVSFDNDEAREAWNAEMADLMVGPNFVGPQELLDHMREFAGSRADVTMESEVLQDNGLSHIENSVTRSWVSKNFIAFSNDEGVAAEQRLAWNKAVDDAFKESGGFNSPDALFEAMEPFLESSGIDYYPEAIHAATQRQTDLRNEIARAEQERAAEAAEEPAADAAGEEPAAETTEEPAVEPDSEPREEAAVQADPYSSEGVFAYLAGESGVGQITDADPAQTQQIAMVASLGRELRGMGANPAMTPRPEYDNTMQMGMG